MTPPTEMDDDVDLVDLVASNIRAEAARQGIYQMDIARALGVRQTTISKRWKGGRAWPLEDLPKVAAVLGVTVAGFPRTRGDEPRSPIVVLYATLFSPHARG